MHVATWDEVDHFASVLPEVSKHTSRNGLDTWKVRGKGFAWERPLRKADYKALGDAAPDGPILGVMMPDLVAKEAMISDDPSVYFTTPHFDGYAAVLIQLDHIEIDDLEEILIEAWAATAPNRLVTEYLENL
jgi:hypothetical protein